MQVQRKQVVSQDLARAFSLGLDQGETGIDGGRGQEGRAFQMLQKGQLSARTQQMRSGRNIRTFHREWGARGRGMRNTVPRPAHFTPLIVLSSLLVAGQGFVSFQRDDLRVPLMPQSIALALTGIASISVRESKTPPSVGPANNVGLCSVFAGRNMVCFFI